MLILRRKRHESIIINGNIRITILEIDGENRVKLGIEAPQEISVNREEVAGNGITPQRHVPRNQR